MPDIPPVLSPFGTVDADGNPVPDVGSIFDAPPEPSRERPLVKTDAEHADVQRRIGDAYAEWDQRQDEAPPPPYGTREWGDTGSYREFSNLLDASPESAAELLRAVQDAVG